MPSERRSVRCGLDVLLERPDLLRTLDGQRVAMLANPTSVDRSFVHAIDRLLERGIRLVRLFGPEHGVRGEAQDMEAVDADRDPVSGLPAVSLYGDTFDSLAPTHAQLDDVDVFLIDLQDIGSRYYTYVYSAMMCAEACTRRGIRVVVLDRPNPIGGAIEGPTVEPGFESFVGMLPLPMRHGLTLAEVLRFARGQGRDLAFEIVPVEGWRRDLHADRIDAPWVIPSPNMPTFETALVYPGQCLLEGTNLSEGRGTTRPFEIFGAPWVDAQVLGATLDALQLPGCRFRRLSFRPTFQKWAGRTCGGLQIHVTDREAFRPVLTSAAILDACRRLFPEFGWRTQAYEFVTDVPAIDLLFGSARPRTRLDRGDGFDAWRGELETPAETLRATLACRLEEYGP